MSGPVVLQAPSAGEALALKRSAANAAYVGGGTALQLAWGVEQAPPVVTLIDVSGLAALKGVALQGDVLRLGTAERLEALRVHPLVQAHAPLLWQSLNTLAALSVRHLATLGGNIGWRWGDTLAPLLVMGARVEIDSHEQAVPLADVLEMNELPLLRAVQVPVGQGPHREVFEKVGLRAAFSPTRLALAMRADLQEGRVVAVQAAVTAAQFPARRLMHAERCLSGQLVSSLQEAALREALLRDLPGDTSRARLAARLLIGHLSQP